MKTKVTDVEASGTPNSGTYLRGDGSWQTPPGGGGGIDLQVLDTLRKAMPNGTGAFETLGFVTDSTGLNANSGPNTDSYFGSKSRRSVRNSTHGVSQAANIRLAGGQYRRGAAAGAGGFRIRMRGGMDGNLGGALALAENRYFQGITNATAMTVDPSSLTNIIGMGCDQTDTNMQILHNSSSGTATKVDLGSNFPAKTSGVDVYRLELSCDPAGAEVNWKVVRENTGHEASGVINSNLPSATLGMRLFTAILTGSVNGNAVQCSVFSWIAWDPALTF